MVLLNRQPSARVSWPRGLGTFILPLLLHIFYRAERLGHAFGAEILRGRLPDFVLPRQLF
jgi:hypothetical protein